MGALPLRTHVGRAGLAVIGAGLSILGRRMEALPVHAQVVGAGVAVVGARGLVVRLDAARFRLAAVVGTDTVVVAVHGQPDADTSLAVIVVGAEVPVETAHAVEILVGASRLTQAEILSTIQAVIAQRIPVRDSVAVVVQTVALLVSRHRRIAGGQTLLAAGAPARAGARIIGDQTPGPHAHGDRVLGAPADPLGQSALLHLLPLYRRGRAALVARRAGLVLAARPAAEGPPILRVDQALASAFLAVVAGGTGETESREEGLAGEESIRTPPRHLLADPVLGAVLHTGPGTYQLPQVKHAPARQAVGVVRTGTPGLSPARRAAPESGPKVCPQVRRQPVQVEDLARRGIG